MTDRQIGKGTILVVDDESIARDLISGFLKKLGYEVAVARDGREAIEVFDSLVPRPIIVVTDIVMPEQDGRSLAEELRRESPNLCVLFVSAYSSEKLSISELTQPNNSFLAKPFSLRNFSAVIKKLAAVAEGTALEAS